MGLGSNPERTIEVLTNSINLRNKNLNYGYGLLTDGKTLDFSKMDAVGSFALGLQESAKDQKSGGKKVEETLPTFSFDSKGNPLILKDGEFVPYKGN